MRVFQAFVSKLGIEVPPSSRYRVLKGWEKMDALEMFNRVFNEELGYYS